MLKACFFIQVLIGIILSSSAKQQGDRLLHTYFLVRHGNRFSHKNNTQPMQITSIGLRQNYLLGLQYREIYVNQKHFLPEILDNRDIYIQSCSTNRTIMSMLAFQQGLYPVGSGQLINASQPSFLYFPDYVNLSESVLHNKPQMYNKTHYFSMGSGVSLSVVHMKDYSQDMLLLFYDDQTCPQQLNWLIENTNNKITQENYKKMLPIIEPLNKKKYQTFLDFYFYEMDIIFTEYYEWGVLRPEVSKHLFQILLWIEQYEIINQFFGKQEQIDVFIGTIFKDVMERFNDTINNRTNRLATIVSASDIVITGFLLYFNLTEKQCFLDLIFTNHTNISRCADYPNFSSSMVLELWETENKQKHYIKIIYKGQQVNICNNSKGCDFQQIMDIMGKQLRKINVKKLCFNTSQEYQSMQSLNKKHVRNKNKQFESTDLDKENQDVSHFMEKNSFSGNYNAVAIVFCSIFFTLVGYYAAKIIKDTQ